MDTISNEKTMNIERIVSEVLKLFYLAGFFQGVILIIALLKKRILQFQANRILLALLISITVILLVFLSWLTAFINLPSQLNPLVMICWFCVSPLFYLYVKAQFEKGFKLQKKHLAFFLLPLYKVYEMILHWIGFPFGIQQIFDDVIIYSHFLSSIYTIHNVVFTYLSIKCLNDYSNSKALFMKRFFYAFILASCLFFLDGLFFTTNQHNVILMQILIVFFSSFVLYVGLSVIRNSSQLKEQTEKYQNIRLSKKEVKALERSLEEIMIHEKVYTDPNLKLLELAQKLNVQENTLSKLFNEHLKKGFYEYLKHYRLLEFEYKLTLPEYRYQKIAAIAQDSGFKSRTTFYQAFKEKHGTSPSEYMKNLSV